MTTNQRICKTCGHPTKLMLPPDGNGPRTFQCIHCDWPDPLKSPMAKWADSPLAAPPTGKKPRQPEG